ncbi:glycoside hydrolase N-terminal domain-containing protein [Haloferula chungangensis]|uniref:Glycoside hydrolase N-terminal domain-containing protein n=1 Tax=Haloferula chungangensis TaxID=1048331 RepID=A0ABW2L8H8_9BACT
MNQLLKKPLVISIFGVFALHAIAPVAADERFVLHYDSPAANDLIKSDGKNKEPNFIKTALPLGNGRLGAMFSGGIAEEQLMLNDITLWMNTKRGQDEAAQSSARKVSPEDFEKVRETYRQEKMGSGPESMEGISTKYLSSKEPLGNYAPFANLVISTGHDASKAKNYKRSLDARNGVGNVSYSLDGGDFTREYFCSFPHDVVAMRYTADGARLDLTISANTFHKDSKVTAENGRISLLGEASMVEDNMEFMQLVQIEAADGEVSAQPDGSVKVSGASDVRIFLAGHTDYLPNYPTFKGRDYRGDCDKAINAATTLGYDAVRKAHVADVTELMERCRLELDFKPSGVTTDKLVKKASRELENLYFNFSRYLQISCSRGAPVPSNLQGLWNASLQPAWNCDYHTDINLTMNYWMVETANLPESFSPYFDYMKVISESGRHTARTTFGIDQGWSMGLNGNVFGFTAQNEHGRRAQQAGHWLSQHLFEHYAFGGDRKFLEEAYPIMKGAAEFFVAHLAPWKDGTLVVFPTWSPENNYGKGKLNKQAWGAAWDQQLILGLFTDCIEASYLLGVDEEFRKELQEMIPKLSPQKIGKHGQLQEWPDDRDDPKNKHRHISHLIALHPGRDISPLTTPALNDAALITMAHRGDESTGWSTGWKTNFWARLHNGDRAHKIYQFLTSKRAYANLFDFHPPFQIDGNFGGGAGVCEMLLQSHLRSVDPAAETIGKAAFVAYKQSPQNPKHFVPVVPDERLVDAPYILHLLPALPSEWAKGKVMGLRARGGLEVDISWDEGKLTQALFRATRDSKFRVYHEGELSDEIQLEKGASLPWPAKR